jgi:acetyl-CoA carboxylase beta subunit
MINNHEIDYRIFGEEMQYVEVELDPNETAIAEPGALIAFAGPRVVRDTTGKDLPEGFQTSEFLLEHGFLDFISHRKELKDKINLYIDLILNQDIR